MAQLKLDGTGVGYESTGGGAPAVCLVHGTGGTGGVWMRQLEGHYVQVEQPDATTAALRDLVTAVASTGTGRAARVG